MLPAPNLDDRTFQDLVDEAKRLVQHRCPEWTDHNVSDPGVTLIEAFAQMVDQLIYRLNRVPDRNYIKFLELIGVELRPPAPAQGKVTFWLSAPQPQTVLVRNETQVATPRTDIHEPIVFSTTRDLEIIPCAFARAGGVAGRRRSRPTTPRRCRRSRGSAASQPRPVPDDALLIGLTEAVPSCAVTLRMDCTVAGVGVDPRRPPLIWEAWTGSGWTPCELDHDDTGGLNMDGDVVLHVPDDHQTSIIARERAGWLRCRLLEPLPEQPTYNAPPRIQAVSAFTIGGTAPMLPRRGAPFGDPRPFRRHARPAVPPRAAPRRGVGPLGHPRSAGRRGHRDLDRGAALRRVGTRRPALPDRRLRRRAPARAGRAPGRRQSPALRRSPAAGCDAGHHVLPQRRRAPGEHHGRTGARAEDQRAVHRARGEPVACGRRCRRGDARRRQGARADAAPVPRSSRHRRGLHPAGA